MVMYKPAKQLGEFMWLITLDQGCLSQCYADLLNVLNKMLTIKVSQCYVDISFSLKVIRSWRCVPPGSHRHVISMSDAEHDAIHIPLLFAGILSCFIWTDGAVAFESTSPIWRHFAVDLNVCSPNHSQSCYYKHCDS